MPHIQVELDAFDRAQSATGITGIPLPQILGGLVLMWRGCWREKTDQINAIRIAGYFGSQLQGLPTALEEVGFLEELAPGVWRVRGAKRYLRLEDALLTGRKKGGEASKGNLIPGARYKVQPREVLSAPEEARDSPEASRLPLGSLSAASGPLTAISDQRSAISKRSSDAEASATEATDQDKPSPTRTGLEPGRPAKTPRKKSANEAWYDWSLEERAKKSEELDQRLSVERVNAAISPLLLDLGRPLLNAIYREYLADPGYPATAAPPWPMALFLSTWGKYRAKAELSLRHAGGTSPTGKPTKLPYFPSVDIYNAPGQPGWDPEHIPEHKRTLAVITRWQDEIEKLTGVRPSPIPP